MEAVGLGVPPLTKVQENRGVDSGGNSPPLPAPPPSAFPQAPEVCPPPGPILSKGGLYPPGLWVQLLSLPPLTAPSPESELLPFPSLFQM